MSPSLMSQISLLRPRSFCCPYHGFTGRIAGMFDWVKLAGSTPECASYAGWVLKGAAAGRPGWEVVRTVQAGSISFWFAKYFADSVEVLTGEQASDVEARVLDRA